ncbi:MAG: hypothetical protein V4649_07345 [Bacteroidota bacterium]
MLARAKNYDIICLQMRNHLPQQESSIKNETLRFVDEVKAIISNESPVKPGLDRFIPRLFNFRMHALKWLAEQPDLDMATLSDATFPSIEVLLKNPKLSLLGENMMFAMRCNMRVVKVLFSQGTLTSDQIAAQFSAAPLVTYEQFLGTLALSIPDESQVQIIADWLHASLYIEFIVLAGILIDEEKIRVSDATVAELSFLIADAAQDYFAIASEMGILPTHAKPSSIHGGEGSAPFDEDQLLSGQGLSDFASHF